MTDQLSGSEAAKAIADPLAKLAGWLAGFVPEGPARTAVLVIECLCFALAPFIYLYYLGVLGQGAAPEGSLERQGYDKLRARLVGDNLAARLYADWLTRFLGAVDHFFGDAGTECQRAFGLKKPAPLWTAPAFDRCLLLALIYPIVTIFVIWAVSGHVGPAEAALDLPSDFAGWQRGVAAAMYGFAGFALWRGGRSEGLKSFVWAAFAVAFAFAAAVSFASSFGFFAVLAVADGIPAGRAVVKSKRPLAALGLTVQMFAGAGLGIAAQGLLAWGLIFHLLPRIGLDLLVIARAVAIFDLPARVGQLFAGFLALK